MTTVFHTWAYGRFIGPNFPGGSFGNINNVRAPIQFKREGQPNILKDDFSSRTDSSIFTSIEPLLLDQSKETS